MESKIDNFHLKYKTHLQDYLINYYVLVSYDSSSWIVVVVVVVLLTILLGKVFELVYVTLWATLARLHWAV